MDFYEQTLGLGMEIIVGIIIFFIVLVFGALIILIVAKGSWGYGSILGLTAFGFCAFGFGKMGYRLTFNKPRNNGGLLSKNWLYLFWCELNYMVHNFNH